MPQARQPQHATVILSRAKLVGATHVVIGSFTLTGGTVTIRAQKIRPTPARMEQEVVRESGALDDLFAISSA